MPGAPGIRVLVVEQDIAAVGRIFRLCAAWPSAQVAITHVASMYEAQQALKNGVFDALLLSRWSDMTADDVQRAVAATPKLPVIVLCTDEDERFALAALHAGAQDCLVKSQLNPQLLSRSLRYAIERLRTQEQLAYLAQFDGLTGLPNRALFCDRLEQAITHAQRKGAGLAVMFLDLDYFKSVNDMLGHDAGDELLTEVAARIKTQIRRGDTFARMGGDEFTVLLEDVRNPSDVAAVAQKFLDVMARAFVVGGEEMFFTTSIGIATYPACGIEPSQLQKNADAALYHAKESGRGCYRFYDPEMNNLAAQHIKTATQLRHAVTRGEFELHYQPLVAIRTGEVLGVEALLRWNHRERGLVGPTEFIPLLEHTGLIVAVGEWAVRAACAQQKAWADAGHRNLRVSVNVSARQFRQKNFVSMIGDALRESGMDPRLLQLEITESMLVENVAAAAATLRALHTMGVRFSIDDFGTGYSSLNYLKQFPLHTLKIDRGFTENITRNDSDAAIVSAIISLGHSLRMSVVAEGVESEQQLNLLRDKGCDAVQGFYFARPMSAAQVDQWLREHKTRRGVDASVVRLG